MAKQCPVDAPRHGLVDCSDDCITRFFEHEEFYFDEETSFACKITRKYRWDTCDIGIGIGRHAYSITLLPSEEVELEEVRRDKFSRALHDQRSTSAEFELSVEETVRDDLSVKDSYFFEHVGENNFKIFGQKRKGQRTYRDAVETLHQTLSQTVTKAAARVSAKNEIAVDIKSEVDNVYRSTRTIRNPNSCQPVTYHFYQLARRMRRRLTLVDVVLKCSPPAGDATPPIGVTTFRSPVRRPAAPAQNIVAPPPGFMTPVDSKFTGASPCDSGIDATPMSETVSRVEFEIPANPEHSREALIGNLRANGDDEGARRVERALGPINDLVDPNGGGLIFEEEVCVATPGFHVEGVVSQCAVCEDTNLRKKELEVERCRLDLEKLRCEIKLCQANKGDEIQPDEDPPGIDPI